MHYDVGEARGYKMGLLRRCGAICGVSVDAQYERRGWLRTLLGLLLKEDCQISKNI